MFRKVNNVWLGWIETHNVSELENISLRAPDFFERYKYALISVIDSNRPITLNMPSFQKMIKNANLHFEQFGDGLLTSGKSIVELATVHHFFNGFDEVWFFAHAPQTAAPTGHILNPQSWLIQPIDERKLGENKALSLLEQWAIESGAIVGVHDGTGIGYITTDETVAQKLEEISSLE